MTPPALYPQAKGRRVVEILATGAQVVVPPSIHESGQPLQWQDAPDAAALVELAPDTLARLVGRLAGAALLVRHWPDFEGSRHDLAAALAGACYHAGWTREETERTLAAVFLDVVDDEKRDRAKAVTDTLDRAQRGEAVTGWPRLAELLGHALAGCLQTWWQLGQGVAMAGLTFGGRTAEQVQAAPMQAAPIQVDGLTGGLTFGGRTAQAVLENNPLKSVSMGLDSNSVVTADLAGDCDTAWASELGWSELLEFERSPEYEGQDRAYPVDALGPIMGPAVEALTTRQQVPSALAAQAIMAAAVTVVQGRFDVECDGRTVPTSLWMALVAAPGERKTSTDAEAFRLLYGRLKEAELRYQVALEAWSSAKGAKDGDDPGPKPRKPSWLLTDTTTEGLLKALDRHWPSLCLTNSDAATWVSGYSMREGRDSSTAATLSQLWSGAFNATARASLDAPSCLYGRRLSLSLMLQPALAAQLFESATLSGQGFLSRCLPAFPPSTIGTRPYRSRQPDARLDAFEAALDALLAMPIPMNLITGELTPQPLALDAAALDAWIEVHDGYERGLLDQYRDIREVANKAPEQVLRLAGLQAALDRSAAVTVPHIRRASVLMDWYLEEWQSMAVRLVEHRQEVALPLELLRWMQQKRNDTGQDVFNLREMYTRGPRIIRNQSQRARELVAELIRRGYLRPEGKDYLLRPDDL